MAQPDFLILAPMDGVLDAPMREVLTSVTRYDYCVSEFIRVNDLPVPESVLLKKMPELPDSLGHSRKGAAPRGARGAPPYYRREARKARRCRD